jgi:hypothetical protein
MHVGDGGLDKGLSRRIYALLGAMAMLLAIGLGPTVTGASAEETGAISFPGGPLTVSVGPLGQCQSSYPNHGNNFYPPNGNVGDCGFFLAFPKAGNLAGVSGMSTGLQAQTYGFNGTAGPFGLDLYKAVEQTPVTGSGTATEPYTETTVFSVNDVEDPTTQYALVTETTTYVNGEPQFVSKFNVKNVTKSPAVTLFFRAIYAGDLYVNGDDFGTGVFLAGPPRFIGGLNAGAGVIGGFQEEPEPALPWSSFQELPYPNVWETVENTVESTQAFDKSIEPAEVDNAAGVEWDQLREPGTGLAAGHEQSFTIINRTQVPSSLQISPTNRTLTQGQTETITVTALDLAGVPYAGKSVHYAVSGANPQSGSVTLNSAGQAQISYVGHNAGIDTIQMFVDLAGSGTQTAGDPSGTATVTFTPLPPTPTPNSSYKVQSIKANSNGTITITFVPTQAGLASLEVTVPTGTIARADAIAARKAKKCKKNQIKIKGKCLPKTTVSGKVTATGVAGVPLTLTVKPSGKVNSALKKGKTVHLTATLTYKSSLGGVPTVQTFHLTVKGKRPHHKKR